MQIEDFAKYNFVAYTTNQSILVCAGPGVIGELTVHTPWASGTWIVYDGLTSAGAQILNITFPSTIVSGPSSPMCCNVGFKSGIYIVTTGLGGNVFVSYRLGN